MTAGLLMFGTPHLVHKSLFLSFLSFTLNTPTDNASQYRNYIPRTTSAVIGSTLCQLGPICMSISAEAYQGELTSFYQIIPGHNPHVLFVQFTAGDRKGQVGAITLAPGR